MQEKFVYFNVSSNAALRQLHDQSVNVDVNPDQVSDAIPTAADSGGDIIARPVGGGASGSGGIPFDVASKTINPPPSGDKSIPTSPSPSTTTKDTDTKHVPPQAVNTIPNPIDHVPQVGPAAHPSTDTSTVAHSTGHLLANTTPTISDGKMPVFPSVSPQDIVQRVTQQLERQGIIGAHVTDDDGKTLKITLPGAMPAIPPTAEPLPHSITFHPNTNLNRLADAIVNQRRAAMPVFHGNVYNDLARAAWNTYRNAVQAESMSFHTTIQNLIRRRPPVPQSQYMMLNQQYQQRVAQLAAQLRSSLAAAQQRAMH